MRFVMVVLAAFALLFSHSNAGAQVHPEFGLIGRLGFANIRGDATDVKSILSYGAGGMIRISLAHQLSVQAELALLRKGAQDDSDEYDSNLRLTYVELPVLAMFRPDINGSVKPAFFAGPAVSLLVSARLEVEGNDQDVSDYYKSGDAGFVLGAGLDMYAGSAGRVFLEGRYTRGLVNIQDWGEDDYSIQNEVWSASVSYMFSVDR